MTFKVHLEQYDSILNIPTGCVSYTRISLCYFCFRWNMVSLVQASNDNVSYRVMVSLW